MTEEIMIVSAYALRAVAMLLLVLTLDGLPLGNSTLAVWIEDKNDKQTSAKKINFLLSQLATILLEAIVPLTLFLAQAPITIVFLTIFVAVNVAFLKKDLFPRLLLITAGGYFTTLLFGIDIGIVQNLFQAIIALAIANLSISIFKPLFDSDFDSDPE
jgi:hypothetical protein